MKRIIGLFILLMSNFLAQAQAPGFDDLKILYADANYEKLVKVAENYTLKDELKKDPIPFVWLAKGLYKISLSGSDDEKYKTAYKLNMCHHAVGKIIRKCGPAAIASYVLHVFKEAIAKHVLLTCGSRYSLEKVEQHSTYAVGVIESISYHGLHSIKVVSRWGVCMHTVEPLLCCNIVEQIVTVIKAIMAWTSYHVTSYLISKWGEDVYDVGYVLTVARNFI